HVYPDGPAPYFGIYAAGKWESLLGQWDHIKSEVSSAIIDAGARSRITMPWDVTIARVMTCSNQISLSTLCARLSPGLILRTSSTRAFCSICESATVLASMTLVNA